MFSFSETQIQEGVNYVIPSKWWNNFKQYHNISNLETKIQFNNAKEIQNINSQHIVQQQDLFSDTMLIDYQGEIINELSEKSNHIFAKHKYISPMILPDVKFKQDFEIVSSSFWNKISKHYNTRYPIITFAFKEYDINISEKIEKNNGLLCPIAQKQIQILFCTRNICSLFIGFLPLNGDLVELIRLLIRQFKFIEMPETKLAFLIKDSHSSIYLSQILSRKIKDLNQGQQFLMIINLQLQEDENNNVPFQQNNVSMQVLNKSMVVETGFNIFDQQMPILRPDHKTISTGAETPLTFSLDSNHQNDYQFQLKEMLREKSQQQIDDLRNMSNISIEGSLIPIDSSSKQQIIKQQLIIIASELIEMAGIYKKKIKDKELF